jgi:hypothetical protein
MSSRNKPKTPPDSKTNHATAFFDSIGHVWTAPWQELSDISAALVGCGHVSGLLMRQVWPLALMLCADRVPNNRAHLEEVR